MTAARNITGVADERRLRTSGRIKDDSAFCLVMDYRTRQFANDSYG